MNNYKAKIKELNKVREEVQRLHTLEKELGNEIIEALVANQGLIRKHTKGRSFTRYDISVSKIILIKDDVQVIDRYGIPVACFPVALIEDPVAWKAIQDAKNREADSIIAQKKLKQRLEKEKKEKDKRRELYEQLKMEFEGNGIVGNIST